MDNKWNKQVQTQAATVDRVYAEVQGLQAEAQEAYDNLSESAQEGDKGKELQSTIDNLQEAADGLEQVKDYLDQASQ